MNKKLQPKKSTSVATTKVKKAKVDSSFKPKKTEASVPAAPQSTYPIVAIGASAGGLEAIEQFLTNVPADSGMAYIVIQHLDPNHKGMLTELLQRITTLPVAQIKNRTRVLPNHVYVIPPNKDISILHGTLYLLDPVEERGMRLPINVSANFSTPSNFLVNQ